MEYLRCYGEAIIVGGGVLRGVLVQGTNALLGHHNRIVWRSPAGKSGMIAGNSIAVFGKTPTTGANRLVETFGKPR